MARIDWIKHRLDNWALWKARESGGSLGFSSTTSFLHEATADRYRESRIPVDEVDASVTDQAVESLKPDRPHLFETLVCIYLLGVGIKETARRTYKAESTVKAHLDQADQALAAWFRDRADRRARGFTS
jgi:DNA-directed RNA polymerase specialized sigma24 family protein